ncbi:hypothetical protein V2A60_010017 [Cordyceps javanica]
MTTDIDGITTGIPQCLQIPIGIVEIVLGMFVLSRFIGISAFAVFGPLVVSTVAAYFISRRMATSLSAWNKGIEVRVAKTAKILPQITAIKMLGLGSTVGILLQHLRDQEIRISRSYRRLQALGMGPILVGDLMTPVVVIAAALFGPAFHGQMSAAEVFPILTIVSIIQRPLLAVLETFSRWGNMLACFSRIQKFLSLPEKRDPRAATVARSGSSSTEGAEISHAPSVVRFRQADIAPLGMEEPLLRKVNFSLAPSSTTGLVGLTGGGKSTIVQGILGQSAVLGGSISVNTSEIGYCGENVWLRDTTIRENIIGDLEFNQARFTKVIRACFLEEDLQWLPGGADYVIGIILAGANYLAGTLPAILIALFFIQRYYLRTSRQVRLLDLEAKAPLHTYLEETAAGLTHIQAFRWQDQNIQRGVFLLEESQKPFYVFLAVQQWLSMVLGLLAAALGTSLVALALFIDQSSSSSAIGLSFMGLIYLNLALQNTLVAWTELETSSGALARLSLFEAGTPQEAKPRRISGELPRNWPSQGQVEMKNVSANYTPENDDSQPALRGVSFFISPGRRIGIMGRSGSGKSSVFLTMLGFVSYEGEIEIDGINIASIPVEVLRSRIITITQDQVQFDANIRTNLLPFTMNDETSEMDEKAIKRDIDLEKLLKSLHIWIPLAKKGGLDAMLEGVSYSKGQMQLLCIARAILRQRETGSRLVLVDEGTSSVDVHTEKIVNRVMNENFVGYTVLTIAHRATAMANSDGLIRLDRGATVNPNRDSDSESEEEAS